MEAQHVIGLQSRTSFSPLKSVFFNFYISNNRNPPITDKMVVPLQSVRAGVNCMGYRVCVLPQKGIDH